MKKRLFLLGLIFLFCSAFFYAEGKWLTIATNVKTSTAVYLDSINTTYSEEEAMVILMAASGGFPYNQSDATFDVKIYNNKTELLTSADFKDEYIYGSATMAVVNLHYGIVYVNYSRYDDEEENFVGWDAMEFVVLDDGRVIWAKILKI